jgi:proline dehydrogenase
LQQRSAMFRELMLRAAASPGLERFVTRNRALRGLVRRFVAGEKLQAGLEAVRRLNSAGARATLDHLGEEVRDPATAARACREYLDLLDALSRERLDANVSLKLTQLGLRIDPGLCERNLTSIVERAAELGNFVRIDMESSGYTQLTLDIFYRLWGHYRNVGVVIQAYLYRSAADVETLIQRGVRVRLCKGAYREPPSVAYSAKRDVDENYRRLMERLLERGRFPALATHDARLIEHARRFTAARAIGSDRFEFQMLYGVRRDLQRAILADGHGLRVYVPYGPDWYPYLTRRLAERPANLLFVVGSLLKERRARRR